MTNQLDKDLFLKRTIHSEHGQEGVLNLNISYNCNSKCGVDTKQVVQNDTLPGLLIQYYTQCR